jgi:hypothetical protein
MDQVTKRLQVWHETTKAVLVATEDGLQMWLPKSKISITMNLGSAIPGTSCYEIIDYTVTMPGWLWTKSIKKALAEKAECEAIKDLLMPLLPLSL